jgi:hypothetical protein
MSQTSHPDRLLGVDQLADLLHRAPHTIRLDACRAPHRLPPICRLPGYNRLLWRPQDVEEWIAAAVTPPEVTAPLPRRRGRPRKGGKA